MRCLLGKQMDRANLNERSGKQADQSDAGSCPKCANALRLFNDILDSRTGEVFRLFRCECGELLWGKQGRMEQRYAEQ